MLGWDWASKTPSKLKADTRLHCSESPELHKTGQSRHSTAAEGMAQLAHLYDLILASTRGGWVSKHKLTDLETRMSGRQEGQHDLNRFLICWETRMSTQTDCRTVWLVMVHQHEHKRKHMRACSLMVLCLKFDRNTLSDAFLECKLPRPRLIW